ncbi:MAG: hypothetical protein ABFS30_06915 [Pseudomonadota bacterium]
MSGEKETRRLLRLRGWGRNGGIHGREVTDKKPPALVSKGPATDRIEGMRRATVLYLTSRECVARDLAFLLLPRASGYAGAGDLMVFTRESVFMVGFAVAKQRPGPALAQIAGRIRDLGHTCRIIHAETPAHAVEQLARLIDGDSGAKPGRPVR